MGYVQRMPDQLRFKVFSQKPVSAPEMRRLKRARMVHHLRHLAIRRSPAWPRMCKIVEDQRRLVAKVTSIPDVLLGGPPL